MKKHYEVIFLVFLLILPCVSVSAYDDPDISITIERGAPTLYGYVITIYNNKTETLTAHYHAEMFGFLPLRHIQHQGNDTVAPNSHTGILGFFFSFVPRIVTIYCICDKEGESRSGLIIGPFIIFGPYKDMFIPIT
jgi:hypothetical protein